ncbi:hypothetical protein LS48_02075 [Aequorivita aquimaris]|uniref:Uncharacterized protein n=1 Tax=Aequorivita aquimaris TaxID=1548749 RepID=A0A137RM47_9FLAO|nr:hypothetical protein LS48_02075 [Aequorivita aquimaris]
MFIAGGVNSAWDCFTAFAMTLMRMVKGGHCEGATQGATEAVCWLHCLTLRRLLRCARNEGKGRLLRFAMTFGS